MNTVSNLRPARLPAALLIALLLVVAAALAGWLLMGRAGMAPGSAPATYTMPVSAAIEARWGVRISQVAVTAAGGLVDLRYTVLDPAKAHAMLESPATTPKIEVPGADVTIELTEPMHHKNDFEAGRTYFILYVNREGALKSNTTAAVTIGDLRLDQVPVR